MPAAELLDSAADMAISALPASLAQLKLQHPEQQVEGISSLELEDMGLACHASTASLASEPYSIDKVSWCTAFTAHQEADSLLLHQL